MAAAKVILTQFLLFLSHLQTTRIAKTVNELRRKTSDETLKRRAKNLLKRWREMVIPGSRTATSATTNTSSAAAPPAGRVVHNGTVSAPVGRPPNKQQQLHRHQQQQQQQQRLLQFQQQNQQHLAHKSSLSSSYLNTNSSSSSNKISPSKLAALSKENNQLYVDDVGRKGQFFHINNNNNNNNVRSSSLAVPSSSTNHYTSQPMAVAAAVVAPAHLNAPVEIINLTEERSNSPPSALYPQQQQQQQQTSRLGKRPRSISPSVAPLSSLLTPSANNSRAAVSLETCDNDNFFDNDSNVSRMKHKKHKRDKKSKSSVYNHTDERSAPNAAAHLEDSVSYMGYGGGSSLPNHLILPDNDSLSNTSASIFNYSSNGSKSVAVPVPPPAQSLTFAGHFTKVVEPPTVVGVTADSIAAPPPPTLVINSEDGPQQIIVPDSRSSSPSAAAAFLKHSGQPLPPAAVAVAVAAPAVNHLPPVQLQQPVAPVEQPPPVVEPKQPKKRGRKKGSKGIDSLLASQNEGALASMLNPDSYLDLKNKITSISAGSKKTKTTKELLIEIQQKRSNSGNISAVTSPSVTQAPSPASSSGRLHPADPAFFKNHNRHF